ncbi:amino acid adenylation domain-containing protein [Nocardia speluncae]|uniref:Amino acid adenylation domain-containing protein n=1 Tax=Nocardia speluncae TaxID=419477 RepID=A0A846XFT4_9NOCA|nr:amino acid adenylation domain-containing protein [Nocardia speluncae]NKY33473.1 amino acid adenylation domain-containing protein [Nocardia speluncae]
MTSTELIRLLDTQVAACPGAVACIDDSGSLSYRELWERAGRGARTLQQAGVAPGDTVGLLLTPSVELVVAVWSILRSGASYLPLAVDNPDERLACMVADSGIRVVITEAGTEPAAARILPPAARTVPIDRWPHDHRGASPAAAVHTDSPAYTIYTSGTTGAPKGVMIGRRAMVNQMTWLAGELGLSPGARILLKTPVGFDAAQWELLANAVGATVVVAAAGTHTSPESILGYILRHRITVVQCVPTMWSELVALPGLTTATGLATVASGGEPLPVPLALRLRETLPGARMINLYGPTETTINATWFDFTTADLTGSRVVPIGRPVPGCHTVVVDPAGAVARDGEIGELLIGGVQLAAGYRARPAETAAKFRTEALGGGAPERRYRTGDLVRRRADGVLEFVGRDDEQVKISGHRVETGEVRVRIEQHHWVRAAAVVPWQPERGGTRLAGFVELDPAEAPLMDQELAGRHHRSKSTRTQVTAQLSDLGLRHFGPGEGIGLPGAEPRPEVRRRVFARKTYRTFDDSAPTLAELTALVRGAANEVTSARRPLNLATLGALLRWLGPFHSPDRLLPKYAYASPGALNATQVYVEAAGLPGLADGVYYFHPVRHGLFRVAPTGRSGVHLHLVGLARVIESVYSTNVREVLHLEAGHMLGVLDEVGAECGWQLRTIAAKLPGGVPEGYLTATVTIEAQPDIAQPGPQVQALVQIHGDIGGTPQGIYQFTESGPRRLTERKIERRHVIAINQRSYDRSCFGIVLTVPKSRGWAGFTELGRVLARLQQRGIRANLGLMSAGYSSLTGRPLPSARRFGELFAETPPADSLTYFALGGRVSDDQLADTGMTEDALHMAGPEELLITDLRTVLPRAMVPATIHVLDRIPRSPNGKQDRAALTELAVRLDRQRERHTEPPRTEREREVAEIWSEILGYRPVYRDDDFFDQGGNSISALRLLRALEQRLGGTLPVQTVFRTPTLAGLSAATAEAAAAAGKPAAAGPDRVLTRPSATGAGSEAPGPSRILRLAGSTGSGDPTTVIWPGLGGYPMSLRPLAQELGRPGRAVYGVQARGLNIGERPHTEIAALVADDVAELLARGLPEPYRIVGYSFGARIAAEVAQQLTEAGRRVDHLVLIAPGSPVIAGLPGDTGDTHYRNPYFKRILASVFCGSVAPAYAADLDTRVTSRPEFLDLIAAREPAFGRDLAERIVTVVEHTYRLRDQPARVDPDLLDSSIFLRARGDGPSFADVPVPPLRHRIRPVGNLLYHHYEIITAGAFDIAAAVLEQELI